MVYKCEKCGLTGAGWPETSKCPNCKQNAFVRRSRGEDGGDMYKGDFIPFADAASELFSILHTFAHTKSQLYVSPDVDEFLRDRGFDYFNYKIDNSLRYLEMNIR